MNISYWFLSEITVEITKYLGYFVIETNNGDDLDMYVAVYESSSESSVNFLEKLYPFP